MIINDNGFIVKGRNFTSSDVERILINYIETENEEKTKIKYLEHAGESLVEYCKKAYEYNNRTCDNFHTLFIRRPYVYKGVKKGFAKDCFADVTITQVLIESNKWKDYIIKSVHYCSDCSINVTAEILCTSVNDLIYFCEEDISEDCIFHDILENKTYDLEYVKSHNEQFENARYVHEVDVNKDNMIKCVHIMM